MKTCKNCYAAKTGAHPMSGQAHGCTLGYKTDGQGHALENCPKPTSWKQLKKVEKAHDDEVNYADYIRGTNNEELALIVSCPNETGLANIICDHSDNCDCFECTLNWLSQKVEFTLPSENDIINQPKL